jgi:hypothetical protein
VSSARTIAASGALVAAAALAFLVHGSAACKSAAFDDAPDADIPCNAGPHVFCSPDAGTGCGTAGASDKRLQQLPQGIYGVGCTANYVTGEKDQGGDCIVSSICRCNGPDDGGAPDSGAAQPHWTCFP